MIAKINEILEEVVDALADGLGLDEVKAYKGYTLEPVPMSKGGKEETIFVNDRYGHVGYIRKSKEEPGDVNPWQAFANIPGVRGRHKSLGSFRGKSGKKKAVNAIVKYRLQSFPD